MKYPDNYLRGISNSDQFDFEIGLPTPRLFPFQSDRQSSDDWIEESISWLDDENAIKLTLNQVKEGRKKQFKLGLAVMKKEGLNHIKAQLKQLFDYKRSPTPNNKHHGSLLVKCNIPKLYKKMLSSWLLVFYDKHIPQATTNDNI